MKIAGNIPHRNNEVLRNTNSKQITFYNKVKSLYCIMKTDTKILHQMIVFNT